MVMKILCAACFRVTLNVFAQLVKESFFEFRSNRFLYYLHVNSLLAHLLRRSSIVLKGMSISFSRLAENIFHHFVN